MKNRVVGFLFLISSLIVAGCSGGSGGSAATTTPATSPTSSTKNFVLTPGTNVLHLHEVDSTGAATFVKDLALVTGSCDFQIAKNNTRLFVDNCSGKIDLYSITKTATSFDIALLSTATVPGTPGEWGICAAPDATAVYAVEYGGTNLYSFKVNGSDQLSYVGTRAAPNYLVNCLPSADSKYIVATGYYGNTVDSFLIDPTTKALSPISSLPSDGSATPSFGGAAWVAESEDGLIYFVANQDNSKLAAFEMNPANGQLTALTSMTPCGSPDYLESNADGTEIYLNCQDGVAAGTKVSVSFNRTTKTFGSAVVASTASTSWFHVAKAFSFLFEYTATTDVLIRKFNSDGSVPAASHTLTGGGAWARTLQLSY